MSSHPFKTFFIVFFLITNYCYSQSNHLPDPRGNFFAIIVEDMETSLDWYSEILGLELLNKIENSERGFIQANLYRGNLKIEIIQLSTSLSRAELLADQPPKTKITGIFKIGIEVDQFDDWVSFLENSEVKPNGSVVTDEPSGKKMLIILDPDGNRIQLFEK